MQNENSEQHDRLLSEIKKCYRKFTQENSFGYCESTFTVDHNPYQELEVAHRDFKRDVLQYISEIPHRKINIVADIGSGFGHWAMGMGKYFQKVYGIESDQKCIQIAKLQKQLHNAENVEFISGKAEAVPLEDESVDFIFFNQVVEHVESVAKSLDECQRILRPDGLLYLATGNYLWIRERHYNMAMLPLMPKWLFRIWAKIRGKNPDFINHINYITPRALDRQLVSRGLLVQKNICESLIEDILQGKEALPDRYRSLRHILQMYTLPFLHPILAQLKWWVVYKIGFYPVIILIAKKHATS